MRKTIILTAALFAALASAAGAAAPHTYRSSFDLAPLSITNDYPSPGGISVLSGTWKVTGLGGNGSLLDHVTITGHPTDAIFTFKGVETGLLPGGTVNSVYTGWSLVQPDGTISIAGDGIVVGGTAK